MESIDLDLLLSSNYVIPVVLVLICAVLVFLLGFTHSSEPSLELVETLKNERSKKTKKKPEQAKPTHQKDRSSKKEVYANNVAKSRSNGPQVSRREQGSSTESTPTRTVREKKDQPPAVRPPRPVETETSSDTDQGFADGWTTFVSRKNKKRLREQDEMQGKSSVDAFMDSLVEEQAKESAKAPLQNGAPRSQRASRKEAGSSGLSEVLPPGAPGKVSGGSESQEGGQKAKAASKKKKNKDSGAAAAAKPAAQVEEAAAVEAVASKLVAAAEENEEVQIETKEVPPAKAASETPNATPSKKAKKKKKASEEKMEKVAPEKGETPASIASQIAEAMAEENSKSSKSEEDKVEETKKSAAKAVTKQDSDTDVLQKYDQLEDLPPVQPANNPVVKNTQGASNKEDETKAQEPNVVFDEMGEWVEAKAGKKKKKLRKDN